MTTIWLILGWIFAILLGPMGYSGATQSVIRIMFAQFFPLEPIQNSTFRWAFSENPLLVEEFGEWFQLIMIGAMAAIEV